MAKNLNRIQFTFRMGLRGRELIHGVGRSMIQSGATFAGILAVGTGIRGCNL